MKVAMSVNQQEDSFTPEAISTMKCNEMYKEQCYSQWNINCKSSKDLEGCSLNFDIMFKPHRIKLRRILCILILQMPSKIHRHKASGHR